MCDHPCYIHRLSEWEHRYKMRESKPEDLEAIRELRMTVREQEQKIKDLVVSDHCTQLHLLDDHQRWHLKSVAIGTIPPHHGPTMLLLPCHLFMSKNTQ